MEIKPNDNLKKVTFPLPIYESIEIAKALRKDGESFSIFAGLNEKMIEQLKIFSTDIEDTEIQNNTSDLKRFGAGSYKDWYQKNRTPFALIHNNTNALAALIWVGPEPLHIGCKCHTMAWRSYKPFRGTGIMKSFTKFAFDFYLESIPTTKFWVAVKKENVGSIKLAEHLGFKISTEYSNNESTILTTYYN
jgi:hypothetical protein